MTEWIFIFLRLNYNGKDINPVSVSLCKTDFDSLSVIEMESFEGLTNGLAIVGCTDACLIFIQANIDESYIKENGWYDISKLDYNVHIYNVTNGIEYQPELHWMQGDLSIVFSDDFNAYIYDCASADLEEYDLLTNEIKSIDYPAEYKDCFITLSEKYGDHLLLGLYDEKTNNSSTAGYDIDTGEIKPIDLWYTDSDGVEYMVTVCSENQNDFLVMCGAEYVKTTDYLPDGSSYTYDARIEKFGLISKEDYWNSVNNIRRFENTDTGMITDEFLAFYGVE